MKELMVITLLLALSGAAATLTVGEAEEYTTPQMAMDCVSDGDTVLIRAGEYVSNESIELWGTDDVCILGEVGTRLICDSETENVMWIINSDRITVSGVSATHTEPTEDERCYGNVFGIDGCDDITIEECEINGCGAIGVYTNLVDGIVLRNNFIHDNTLWAVQHEGNDLIQESHHIPGLTMEGNTILNNGGRQLDMVYSSGSSTAEFAGVLDDDGYLIFQFRNPNTEMIDSYYLTPGCTGIWLDIVQNPEVYLTYTLEFEWQEVLTSFMVYDRYEEAMEITSVSLPD